MGEGGWSPSARLSAAGRGHWAGQLSYNSFQKNGMPAMLTGDVPAPQASSPGRRAERDGCQRHRVPRLSGAPATATGYLGSGPPLPTQVSAAEVTGLQEGELSGAWGSGKRTQRWS